MIRIILYNIDGNWVEGVLHTFVGEKAVVENKQTGELNMVPVKPIALKFKNTTEQWVQMQIQAQREAQNRSVLAGAPPLDMRR